MKICGKVSDSFDLFYKFQRFLRYKILKSQIFIDVSGVIPPLGCGGQSMPVTVPAHWEQ